MHQFGYSYLRCTRCVAKPATLKCNECEKQSVYCFQCDKIMHDDQNSFHRRSVIQYDQLRIDDPMKLQQTKEDRKINNQIQLSGFQNDTQSIFLKESDRNVNANDNKENLLFTLNKAIQETSTTIAIETKTPTKTKQLESKQVSETNPFELKYKIKYQEQENRIALLKQHIEKIEETYVTNLKNLREEKLLMEKQNIDQDKQFQESVQSIKLEYEKRMETLNIKANAELQNIDKLNELLQQQQDKSNQVIQQLRKELNQLKQVIEDKEDEKLSLEEQFQHQLEQVRIQQMYETEKIANQLTEEYSLKQTQLFSQIQQKDSSIHSLEIQIEKLKLTLEESTNQQKKLEEKKNSEIEFLKNQIEIIKEKHSEVQIDLQTHQKGMQLQAGDVVQLQQQFEKIKEINEKQQRKIEKYEKLIYGGKKR